MNAFHEARCTSCHHEANFSGPGLPIGTGFFTKFPVFPDGPYVVAFLESLTGSFPQQSMPRLPPTPGDLLE